MLRVLMLFCFSQDVVCHVSGICSVLVRMLFCSHNVAPLLSGCCSAPLRMLLRSSSQDVALLLPSGWGRQRPRQRAGGRRRGPPAAAVGGRRGGRAGRLLHDGEHSTGAAPPSRIPEAAPPEAHPGDNTPGTPGGL